MEELKLNLDENFYKTYLKQMEDKINTPSYVVRVIDNLTHKFEDLKFIEKEKAEEEFSKLTRNLEKYTVNLYTVKPVIKDVFEKLNSRDVDNIRISLIRELNNIISYINGNYPYLCNSLKMEDIEYVITDKGNYSVYTLEQYKNLGERFSIVSLRLNNGDIFIYDYNNYASEYGETYWVKIFYSNIIEWLNKDFMENLKIFLSIKNNNF